jgi:hypothetical protein
LPRLPFDPLAELEHLGVCAIAVRLESATRGLGRTASILQRKPFPIFGCFRPQLRGFAASANSIDTDQSRRREKVSRACDDHNTHCRAH